MLVPYRRPFVLAVNVAADVERADAAAAADVEVAGAVASADLEVAVVAVLVAAIVPQCHAHALEDFQRMAFWIVLD